MSCPDFDVFMQHIQKYDQAVEIDKAKDKPLRYNVWETTKKHVQDLITKLDSSVLPNKDQSRHVLTRIDNGLRRIREADKSADQFIKDVIQDENNIQLSIALHEVMESVKGEADKARNNGLEINKISNDNILPALPLARIAASIGRKIAFQKGYRFHNVKHTDTTAAEIEELYYRVGIQAITRLQKKGYLNVHDNMEVIKDYIHKSELKKERHIPVSVEKAPAVSLNSEKLGINTKDGTADYFLDRSVSDISATELGTITEILRTVKQVTQPATVVLPDNAATEEDLARWDDPNIAPDEKTAAVREALYKQPLYVNESVHDLLTLLNQEAVKTGMSASQLIQSKFRRGSTTFNSLFGLKRSDDFSIDRKESVSGQNLSKTTPLDDLVEYYDLLTTAEGKPSALHMPLKIGRNARLYYVNSVLNPHASKQSRYMLTAGKYTVDTGTADYDYLVYGLKEALGDKSLSYSDFVGDTESKLDNAIQLFKEYQTADTLTKKLAAISSLSHEFPGVDYVTMLTAIQGVMDIRNPVNGKVTTQFQVSADATASGGTLTFIQALGSNPAVTEFLEDIGFLKKTDGLVEISLPDLYAVMSDSITKFIAGENIETLVDQDRRPEITGTRKLMQDTLNMLFSDGDQIRDLSKEPTMTFVYGQGRGGAVETLSRSLADRIIDSLDSPQTRQYLANLMGDGKYNNVTSEELKDTRGLYKNIVTQLKKSGLPEDLYSLIDASINEKYLKDYKTRSDSVFNLVKKLPVDTDFKILPAGAVLSLEGKPTLQQVRQYGMPLSKVFEVASNIPNTPGLQVLTRKQRLQKTVMDVSTIHSNDAALLYHSLGDIDTDSGVVVIHDDIRGDVQTVRAMEEQYKQKAVEIGQSYDIHQQILESLALYSPELAETAEYQQLKSEIDRHVQTKQKILKDQFNEETSALIGDGKAFEEFAGEPKPDVQPKRQVKPENREEKRARLTLESFAEESPLIRRFLETGQKVTTAKANEFVPSSDTVTISRTGAGRDEGPTGKLDLRKTEDRRLQKELIEHEIVHAFTAGFIAKTLDPKDKSPDHNARRDIKYVLKALDDLKKFHDRVVKSADQAAEMGTTLNRIEYIIKQPNDPRAIAEFISIMRTEPEHAAKIYAALNKTVPSNRLMQVLDNLVKRIQVIIRELTDRDFEKEIDIKKLYGAIERTVQKGEAFKTQQRNLALQYQAKFDKAFKAGPNYDLHTKAPKVSKASMRYLNYAVASMLNSKLEKNGKRVLGAIDTVMRDRFPIYTDVANKLAGVYDTSPALQQLVHTITGNNIDKLKKADILAKFNEITNARNDVINHQLREFNRLLRPYTEAERNQIGRYVLEGPLHDYFILADDLTTEEQITDEIANLEKKFKNDPVVIKDIERLVAWNTAKDQSKVEKPRIYSLEQAYPMGDSDFGMDVRKYYALKSIEKIGIKPFGKMLENTDLTNLIKDQVVANRMSLLENQGTHKLRDNLIADYFAEDVQVKAISLNDIKFYQDEDNSGWKVLQHPTNNSPGIAYKPTVDSTSIAGAFTDTKLSNADVDVSSEYANYPGVVETKGGYKLLLTKQQKKDLGILQDFSQQLVRTTAHNMAIQESQIIRDELLKKETLFTLDSTNMDLLETKIEADNIDSPWFIKLPEGVEYSRLPDTVKAKYQPVAGRASDVKGFNENVDLVRKDISHWLLGGSASSLFQNPKMKWMMRIVKDLIAGAKIGMVVLNPVKIAKDNVSNLSYLGVMGVDPRFIAKNYKEIAQDFADYQELKSQITALKVQLVANPNSTKIQKRIKNLEARIKQNSVGDLADKGFINSLGSDIVSKNSDTLSGLQADVHKALEYLLLDKKGNRNHLGEFVNKLHKLGFQGEDFLGYIGGIFGRFKSTEGVQRELDRVADRLKEVRTEEDVVGYVSQYLNSPGSEAVRMGSAMTDLTDVMAKETLYRHLVQEEGMSPEDARLKVLDSFPDYKENMPLAVKQLSDVGILMFPSFWMRIQKSIYRLGRDRPINLSTELMVEEALDSNIDTIVDQNLLNKANTFGGLIHSPHEPIGVGSIIPTHLF